VGTDTTAPAPIPQPSGRQAYTWSFPICPHTVRVNLTVVGALQHQVSTTSGPQQGLLIGHRRYGVTHIEAYRPLPAFDAQTLTAAIEKTRRPAVGYYRIRDGCAFIFEAAEIDLCKSAFPELGSVLLLVERRAEGPAEGSFAFWRTDAFVSNLPSPFPIDPEILAREPQPADPIRQDDDPEAGALRFLRRNAGTFGLLGAALLLVLILPLLWVGTQSPAERGAVIPVETVPVDANQSNIQVEWDRQAIAGATGGLLRIMDGRVQHHVPLTLDQLRQGTFLYTGGPGPISFEMRALGADGQVFEVPTSAHAPAARRAPEVQRAAVTAVPPPAPARTPAPAKLLQQSRTPASPVLIAVERKPAAKPFTLGLAERRMPSSAPALDDAPPLQPILNTAPVLTASIPASAPPPAPERPATSSPAEHLAPRPTERTVNRGAGRLIWTGTLERRGVLEFDQRSVSVGSLNGALPGVPVKVTVSPAEFGTGGLMVYTTDPKLDKHVEPPSAGNGWNRITYVWDPERVRQIAVLESPNASNRFSHLALRSDARRCSMLVIDWAAR
jgi:hypothetical protein